MSYVLNPTVDAIINVESGARLIMTCSGKFQIFTHSIGRKCVVDTQMHGVDNPVRNDGKSFRHYIVIQIFI